MTDTDWRLNGQENYLAGAVLFYRAWRQSRPNWDHDHCAFCGVKFAAFEGAGILHEGWTTDDEYHWICDTCFRDFRERFDWTVGA